MEAHLTESPVYKNPETAFQEVIGRMNLGGELGGQFAAYLKALQAEGVDVKDASHQEAMKPILEGLLAEGKKEEAGLLFNIHRTLTEFRGYGANEGASSDVPEAFQDGVNIPKKGLIVIDLFVTRNLPAVIETLEKREVDLSRVRVVAPKGVLAAQLMNMSDEKRAEVEAVFAKLTEGQLLVEDVNHVNDIQLEGKIGVWFSPRTMPIHPRLHAETEEETVNNLVAAFRERAKQVVKGGRIFANLAYSEAWEPLAVETAGKNKDRTKLTGISKAVAEEVVEALIDEGFTQIKKGEFNPSDVAPETDHLKMATWLHMVKTTDRWELSCIWFKRQLRRLKAWAY